MRITNEVVEAHRQLSDTSVAFLEFAQRNPDCLDRVHFDMLLSDKRFTYFRSQPWPTFINGKCKKEMEGAVRKIHELIISVIPRFFSYDLQKISSYYRVDPAMTKLLLHGVNDDYIANLLGRGDFIRTPAGEFKCLEFNMHA
ncbi:MAG: hypothetical protein GY950_11405, partial [bacterium]|nr:hypothetical protein [bacterium]